MRQYMCTEWTQIPFKHQRHRQPKTGRFSLYFDPAFTFSWKIIQGELYIMDERQKSSSALKRIEESVINILLASRLQEFLSIHLRWYKNNRSFQLPLCLYHVAGGCFVHMPVCVPYHQPIDLYLTFTLRLINWKLLFIKQSLHLNHNNNIVLLVKLVNQLFLGFSRS